MEKILREISDFNSKIREEAYRYIRILVNTLYTKRGFRSSTPLEFGFDTLETKIVLKNKLETVESIIINEDNTLDITIDDGKGGSAPSSIDLVTLDGLLTIIKNLLEKLHEE